MNMTRWFSLATTNHPAKKNGLPIALLVLSLIAMFGPSWHHYLAIASDPYHFNGDIRTFGPSLYRFVDSTLFSGSLDVDYFSKLMPIGYQSLFALVSQWADPLIVTKILGGILFFIGLCALGVASFRLGGWAGAWVSMALVLSVGPDMSGLPHDFSWPVLCSAAAALLYGRVTLLALCVIIGAAFYHITGIIIAIMLFLWLFVWPQEDRGEAKEWSFKQRTLFLVITGLLFIAVEAKQILGAREYAPILTQDYCQEYPEIGPTGRLGNGSICLPLQPLSTTIMDLSMHSLTDLRHGEPFFYSLRVVAKWSLGKLGIPRDRMLVAMLWGFILAGVMLHLVRDSAGRRLLIVLMAGFGGYFMAQPLVPTLYFPWRYLEKTLPLFMFIALPASAAGLFTFLSSKWDRAILHHALARPAFVLLIGISTLLLLGGRGNQHGGFDKDLTQFQPLMEYLKTLPKEVKIAGWPKGVTESIPFLTRRSVLLSHETHVPFHKKYVDDLRPVTYAFLDAYFATSIQPLIQLREQFGVTHLLLEPKLLDQGKLRHFSPFIEYAHKKRQEGKKLGFELLRQIPYAQTFTMQNGVVLDLRRLNLPVAEK